MKKSPELKFLKTIKTGKELVKLLNSLITIRRKTNAKAMLSKRSSLTLKQRKFVLDKTDGHCHICGGKVNIDNFQADHVISHKSGGTHDVNNYLPSCFTCNNYRWHYSSEELQIILKLGVWAKTKIKDETKIGLEIANQFIKKEMGMWKRRKNNSI